MKWGRSGAEKETGGGYDWAYAQAARLPLRWYKALIWFLLWFSALMMLVQGFRYMTGKIYDEYTAMIVYGTMPRLQTVDRLYGIALTVLGVFSVLTRSLLFRFKRRGPLCLYLCWGLQAAANAVYVLANPGDLGSRLATCASSVIAALILIVPSWVYFSKRAALFRE